MQKIISPTCSTPPIVAPLLSCEHAILVSPYHDGKHDPTSQQCVDGTTLPVQPGAASGMRAVEDVLKSPEHSSAEYGAAAFKTTGSRLRTSYAPKEAAVDTSDGLINTGVGPTVFLPPRSKGPDARSMV